MSDAIPTPHVFLSYKSEEVPYAQAVRDALVEMGFEVWWNRDVQTGAAWQPIIDQKLMTAACVVVLWSSRAAESKWVTHEATLAMARGVYAPAMLENVAVPEMFHAQQAAWLMGWDGSLETAGFSDLVRQIAGMMGMSRDELHAPQLRFTPWKARVPRSLQASLIAWIRKNSLGLVTVGVAAAVLGTASFAFEVRLQGLENVTSTISSQSDNLTKEVERLSEQTDSESQLLKELQSLYATQSGTIERQQDTLKKQEASLRKQESSLERQLASLEVQEKSMKTQRVSLQKQNKTLKLLRTALSSTQSQTRDLALLVREIQGQLNVADEQSERVESLIETSGETLAQLEPLVVDMSEAVGSLTELVDRTEDSAFNSEYRRLRRRLGHYNCPKGGYVKQSRRRKLVLKIVRLYKRMKPDETIDLRRACLRGVKLKGGDLSGANLRGADLRDAHFEGVDLQGVEIGEDDSTGSPVPANLKSAAFIRSNLENATIDGRMNHSWFHHVCLVGSTISTTQPVKNMTFQQVDLRGANLSGMKGKLGHSNWRMLKWDEDTVWPIGVKLKEGTRALAEIDPCKDVPRKAAPREITPQRGSKPDKPGPGGGSGAESVR